MKINEGDIFIQQLSFARYAFVSRQIHMFQINKVPFLIIYRKFPSQSIKEHLPLLFLSL